MFGLSGFELFLILLFGFLIFGPDKLPAIAQTVARAVQKFRSAQEEVNKVVKTEIYDPLSKDPVKNPLDTIDKENKNKVENKESYAARKAKYDKERAERKKREAAADAARDTREQVAEENKAAEAAGEEKVDPSATYKRVMDARKDASEKAVAEAAADRQAERELADEILGVRKKATPTTTPEASAAEAPVKKEI